jgi:tetratricopeptide (TPR) repeat protein
MASRATESDQQTLQTLLAHVRERPEDVDALVRLGALMFYPFHNTEVAIFYLESAIAQAPENVEARFWLGNCLYHDQFDLAEAQTVLEEAVALAPERPDVLTLLSAVMAERHADPASWAPLLERAVALAPDWVMPRERLARAYLALGRLDEAEAQIEAARPLVGSAQEPEDGSARYIEFAITGRLARSGEQRLNALLAKIRQA